MEELQRITYERGVIELNIVERIAEDNIREGITEVNIEEDKLGGENTEVTIGRQYGGKHRRETLVVGKVPLFLWEFFYLFRIPLYGKIIEQIGN